MDKATSIDKNARIRSYVLRAGRLTTGQAHALENLGSRYKIPAQEQAIDWLEVFGNEQPLVFEIGFGMGEATAQIAQNLPHNNFIACEVHPPGVGALLMRLRDMNLQNVRIVQCDAVEVLSQMVADSSLAAIHIFFPDPWHKKRHHKRRLIQAPLLELLLQKLAVGGYIHVATDWQDYAQQILALMQAHPRLNNMATDAQKLGYADKPAYRPLTKFENRGLRLGHGVWDLVFSKSH